MDLGTGFLLSTVLFSLGSAVADWFNIGGRTRAPERVAPVLNVLAFASATFALAMIIWMALHSDFTYRYIWAHSSTSIEPVYRVSSIWAAGEGAILLCVWLISLAQVVEIVSARRRSRAGGRFQWYLRATLSILIAIFSFMVLSMGLFDRTTDAELLSNPEGQGMNFLLRTPEMAVHAPIIFGAYACLAALFAASLARLITDDEQWSATALFWGRLGWLLLTIGILIGAVWAYYVIGWGGYWSWDPVETSSLLPWLMTTAFLHTMMRRSSSNEYRVTAPSFGLFSFIGVVFVSFIVRAGGLWVSSVHDYGFSSGSSSVSRLVSLLQEEPSVAGTFSFMLCLLIVSVMAIVSAMRRMPSSTASPKTSKLVEYVNDRDNMSFAILLMSMTALLAIILLLKNTNSDQAGMYAESNQKMSVVFVALMITMSLCLIWRSVGRERAFWFAIALVLVSVALAIVSALVAWSDPLVVFSLPSYIVATASSAWKIVAALRTGTVVNRVRRASAQVVHMGLALVLVGFVVSSNLQSFPEQGYNAAMPLAGELGVGDYSLRLLSIEVSNDSSGFPAGVAQIRTALVEVSLDGKIVEKEGLLRILYGYDPLLGYHILETVPYVRSSPSGDLFLSYEWMSEDIVLMHAKIVPLMSTLWGGAVLLCLGMSIRLLTSREPDAGTN